MLMRALFAVAILVGLSTAARGAADLPVRIKDLTSIEGVRENPLVGYGLVVGLNGTGDRRQTLFSTQSLANLLQQMGVTVPASQMLVQDVAAVMVTASLPPFARPGARLDVTVAAIGDASSLQGGILVLTSLRGVDNRVYAIAQGPLVLGGYTAGRGGNTRTVNHPTTARIPAGGIVEVKAPSISLEGELRLQLHQADFTTASRIAAALNRRFPGAVPAARATDSASVAVTIPKQFAAQPADFIAEIENLTVTADAPAKVVVNERTGTVVMGQNVRIAPVTIVHGSLTVEIHTAYEVSQPGPFSPGSSQIIPQTAVQAVEPPARNVQLPSGATVEELVRSLTAIGVTARDVIAILQNLRSAGALQAELEII
jgi:flagellar P-ring protein precursor FlgI